jgi:EAL domain-containing protein (putative c-di-GMP-specific phosphodiesterase class I)
VVLARLHEAGVRISIDDFGIGQTSLSYLSALPIDEIKIDQSFVTDLTSAVDRRSGSQPRFSGGG